MSTYAFAEYGYGDTLTLEQRERLLGKHTDGNNDGFGESWHYDVLEDHILLSALGTDLRDRPEAVRRAHLAILAGKGEKHKERSDEAERKGRKAERKANQAG